MSVARTPTRRKPVPPRPFEVVLTPPRPLEAQEALPPPPPQAQPSPPTPARSELPEVLPEPVRKLRPPTGARATVAYRSPHAVGAVVRELTQAPAAEEPVGARGARLWPIVLSGLGVGAVVILGLIAYALLAHSGRPQSGAAPVAASSPDVVRIAVATTPADAQLFLDGVPVTKLPIDLPRASHARRLTVRAQGFETQEMELMPDRDRDLRIALAPALPAPPRLPPAPGRRPPSSGQPPQPPRRSLYLGHEL